MNSVRLSRSFPLKLPVLLQSSSVELEPEPWLGPNEKCPTHACPKIESLFGSFNRRNNGKPWNPLLSEKAKSNCRSVDMEVSINVIPPNGWFTMENPIKVDDLEVPPISGNPHMVCNSPASAVSPLDDAMCHCDSDMPSASTGQAAPPDRFLLDISQIIHSLL